jgi:hypothetical protein
MIRLYYSPKLASIIPTFVVRRRRKRSCLELTQVQADVLHAGAGENLDMSL